MADKEADHRDDHQADAQGEEFLEIPFREDDRTGEAADRTEQEIDARSDSRFGQRKPEPLDEDLRSSGVDAYVDAHMRDDAQEEQQHRRDAQQFDDIQETGGSSRRGVFLHLGDAQIYCRDHADDQEDGIKDAPVAELDGSPAGKNRGDERGDGLDELPEGQRTGQLVTFDDQGDQRVEGNLHEGVSDTEQAEGHQHHRIVVAEKREQQRQRRDEETDDDRLAFADLVHQQARRHAEEEEPQEDHRWQEVRHRVAQVEVRLDIIGGRSDHIDEAHREKREHDGDELREIRVLAHGIACYFSS